MKMFSTRLSTFNFHLAVPLFSPATFHNLFRRWNIHATLHFYTFLFFFFFTVFQLTILTPSVARSAPLLPLHHRPVGKIAQKFHAKSHPQKLSSGQFIIVRLVKWPFAKCRLDTVTFHEQTPVRFHFHFFFHYFFFILSLFFPRRVEDRHLTAPRDGVAFLLSHIKLKNTYEFVPEWKQKYPTAVVYHFRALHRDRT